MLSVQQVITARVVQLLKLQLNVQLEHKDIIPEVNVFQIVINVRLDQQQENQPQKFVLFVVLVPQIVKISLPVNASVLSVLGKKLQIHVFVYLDFKTQ